MSHVYVFDIDGTLTPPGEPMEPGFAEDFLDFCRRKDVYLITGSMYEAVERQVGIDIVSECLGVFSCLGNLLHVRGVCAGVRDHIFPKKLHDFLANELRASQYRARFAPHEEMRYGMLNFSTVGRGAMGHERTDYAEWDAKYGERAGIVRRLEERFPQYEAWLGGQTSIDIAPKGWNKAQIMPKLAYWDKITFVADKTGEGGNDVPLAQALRDSDELVPVSRWEDTAAWISQIK